MGERVVLPSGATLYLRKHLGAPVWEEDTEYIVFSRVSGDRTHGRWTHPRGELSVQGKDVVVTRHTATGVLLVNSVHYNKSWCMVWDADVGVLSPDTALHVGERMDAWNGPARADLDEVLRLVQERNAAAVLRRAHREARKRRGESVAESGADG